MRGTSLLPGDRLLSNRRRLAGELRRLRDQAELSGRQLAERIGISQSKVSRIESGTTLPAVSVVTAWAVASGAGQNTLDMLTTLAEAAYTDVHPWSAETGEPAHLQSDIQEIEDQAYREFSYQPALVPGLLQTAEYARRVFTMFEPYAGLDIPAVVAARQDRQVALFDPARRFEFLITESALRWRIGPAAVLLPQLDRIASLSTLENVSIGLIPLTAPAVVHAPHGFTIFETAEEPETAEEEGADTLVIVETVHANLAISGPPEVELYRRLWTLLSETAVYGDTARLLLGTIATDVRPLDSETG